MRNITKLLTNYPNFLIKFTKVHLKPPTSTPHQKPIPYIQTIWNNISSLTPDNYPSNINKISTLIQSLDKKQQESAIKYLMATLYKNSITEDTLRQDIVLKQLLKEYPYIRLEMIMYIIGRKGKQLEGLLQRSDLDAGEKQRKMKIINDQINNQYLLCFKDILHSAQGTVKLQVSSLLYKNFGKHLLKNNIKEKGLSSLLIAIENHRNLVIEEYKRLEQFNKKREKPTKNGKQRTKQQKQKEALTANAMKQNIRRLIQSTFQTLYLYYQHKKQYISLRSADMDKQTQITILDLCAVIGQTMKLKSIVPGIRQYSRYYHRLMCIHLQLQYAFCLRKNKERVDTMKKLMKSFYDDCLSDIQEMTQVLEIQKQIALAMMSMKLHLSRSDRKNTKQELVSCIQQILERGKFENSQHKQYIMKLLSQFMKSNTKN